jgi:autotransporter-associated beta strand protein
VIQRLAGWWLAVAVVAAVLGAAAGTVSAATTRTWTGAGATDNWSDAANWDSGVPAAGDMLVFPAGAARKTNTNDLAAGLTFDTVRFTGGGYRLQGNAFEVTAELRNEGPSGDTNTVGMAVGGTGGVAQVSGRMALTGANTFTGVAVVSGGTLLVTHDSGLGADTAGTTVSAGATLQLSGFTDIGDEPVLLAGAGVGGWGALQSLSGTNYASGVTLSGPVVIGVGQSTLVLDGLDQAAPGASLALVGGGKLQVDGTGTFAGPVTAEHGNLTWNSATPGAATVLRDGWLRGTGAVGSIDVTAGLVWPGSGSSPGTHPGRRSGCSVMA